MTEPVEVEKLHGRVNHAYAQVLRHMADRVESETRPIRAFAWLIVYGDGSIGTEYEIGPAYAPLVGALDHLKYRILKAWEED